MAKKKEVYKVKPLNENKKTSSLLLSTSMISRQQMTFRKPSRIFFGGTIKSMMEAEMDEHLGYESYERSDNVSNTTATAPRTKKMRSSLR